VDLTVNSLSLSLSLSISPLIYLLHCEKNTKTRENGEPSAGCRVERNERDEHGDNGGAQREGAPAELRAHGGAGEDDMEPIGGAEIDGGGAVACDEGTLGRSRRGSAGSVGFGGKLQRQELPVHACHGLERSESVPPRSGADRSLPWTRAIDFRSP